MTTMTTTPLLLLWLQPMELIAILAVVVLLFGATRLPKLGRALGEGIKNFKGGLRELDADDKDPTGGGPSKDS